MELLFTEMGEIVEGTELKWNQDLDFEHVKSEGSKRYPRRF